MTDDLIRRCARHGWQLRPDGDGYELLGNGSPAYFSNRYSLLAWLDKVDKPTKVDPNQVTMFNEDETR